MLAHTAQGGAEDMLVAVDGLKVKTLRKASGISQAECAKRAGISRKTLQHLEASRDARPNTVTAVADVLGVDKRSLAGPRGRLIVLKAS